MSQHHGPDPAEGAPRTSWPDMPLIIEQLQDQIEALRAVAENQDRQLAEHRSRLDALEGR